MQLTRFNPRHPTGSLNITSLGPKQKQESCQFFAYFYFFGGYPQQWLEELRALWDVGLNLGVITCKAGASKVCCGFFPTLILHLLMRKYFSVLLLYTDVIILFLIKLSSGSFSISRWYFLSWIFLMWLPSDSLIREFFLYLLSVDSEVGFSIRFWTQSNFISNGLSVLVLTITLMPNCPQFGQLEALLVGVLLSCSLSSSASPH